jgi:hypothetical protein
MAAQSSFDITSTIDLQEVDNAVNQAKKEIGQRYDFKGSKSSIDFKRGESVIDLVADDNFKMEAVWDILQTRMVRRGVPVRNLDASEVLPVAGGLVKRTVTLKQGISTESAKSIVEFLKTHGLKKVQATIQADQVRVSSSSKDELQNAVRLLKTGDFGVELQFGNYRGRG